MKTTYNVRALRNIPDVFKRDYGNYINEDFGDFRELIDSCSSQCEKSYKKLVASQLPLISKLIGKFGVSNELIDDAAQVCALAVYSSVLNFDHSKLNGGSYATYVHTVIKFSLLDYLNSEGVVSRPIQERKIQAAIVSKFGSLVAKGVPKNECIQVIAKERGKSEKYIRELVEENILYEGLMIVNDDGDLMPNPRLIDNTDSYSVLELENVVEKIIEYFGDRSEILLRYFGLKDNDETTMTALSREKGTSSYFLKKALFDELQDLRISMSKEGLSMADFLEENVA